MIVHTITLHLETIVYGQTDLLLLLVSKGYTNEILNDKSDKALPLLVFFTNNTLMKPNCCGITPELEHIRCVAVGEKHTTAAEEREFFII